MTNKMPILSPITIPKEIDTKNSRLTNDNLHIFFSDGQSYVFSLEEIILGLTECEIKIPDCECNGKYYHIGCKLVFGS